MTEYGLLHITVGEELFTPLVASQLFDQAQEQAVNKTGFYPEKVGAWAIEPFRVFLSNKTRNKIRELRQRCPGVDIQVVGGVNRLKNWPAPDHLRFLRRKIFGKIPVVYHCRGESAVSWALQLKSHFPGDRILLDVRGHWPSEALYRLGKELLSFDDYKAHYGNCENEKRLEKAISVADAVSTVSVSLKDLIEKEYNYEGGASVVPCCISKISDRSSRNIIRKNWGVLSHEKILVYSGGMAEYQHFEDLILPFMTCLLKKSKKVYFLVLSHEKEHARELISRSMLDKSRVIIEAVPQAEVSNYLSACDAGLMIRKPTLVNQLANPVKIAEYLGAGLPVILQKGIGGVEQMIREYQAGLVTDFFNDRDQSVNSCIQWLENQGRNISRNAVRLAREKLLWRNSIQTHRETYKHLIC